MRRVGAELGWHLSPVCRAHTVAMPDWQSTARPATQTRWRLMFLRRQIMLTATTPAATSHHAAPHPCCNEFRPSDRAECRTWPQLIPANDPKSLDAQAFSPIVRQSRPITFDPQGAGYQSYSGATRTLYRPLSILLLAFFCPLCFSFARQKDRCLAPRLHLQWARKSRPPGLRNSISCPVYQRFCHSCSIALPFLKVRYSTIAFVRLALLFQAPGLNCSSACHSCWFNSAPASFHQTVQFGPFLLSLWAQSVQHGWCPLAGGVAP